MLYKVLNILLNYVLVYCAHSTYQFSVLLLQPLFQDQKVFSAFNGGKYMLKGVESVIIEKVESNNTWEKLGNPSDESSAKFQFVNSDKNVTGCQ